MGEFLSSTVFISYSSKDAAEAAFVCAGLEQEGHTCWIAPRDILPGSSWSEAIIDGINVADIFLLVFSSNSNASQQVVREVERGVNRGIPIIPLRIEDVTPRRGLEYFMSATHWFDALPAPTRADVQKLVAIIAAIESGSDNAAERYTPPASPSGGRLVAPAIVGAGAGALVMALAAIALLAGMGPPSDALGWGGALASVPFGALLGWFGRPVARRGVMIAAVISLGLGLALYAWSSENFILKGPSDQPIIRGSECTPDAQLVYETQCPDLPATALEDAAFKAELLWTQRSIARARQAIAAGWTSDYSGRGCAGGGPGAAKFARGKE